MPTLPQDYWASYQYPVASLEEYMDAVRKIAAYQRRTASRFVWRGAANADWALHPSLVRAYLRKHGGPTPLESTLRDFEAEVLDEARAWGLDWHSSGGRLAALEPRMVRQEGCFLMGGVPSTQPARNLRVGVTADRLLRAPEVRQCMSVPFVLINYQQAEAAFAGTLLAGAPPKARSFTLCITGHKAELRAELNQIFGYGHRSRG